MKQSIDRISIITVVYNSATMLEETIKSVLYQKYKAIDYIIIDGGSTDGTIDIIKRYENKLSGWVSEKDNGIYHAMNKGIKLASGQWICFLNSGDIFVDETSIQKVADGINLHPDADIVYGDIQYLTKDKIWHEKVSNEPCNKHRMFFCHQSSFVKKALLLEHPFDIRYKFSADLKFFKECYHKGYKFVHLNFSIVKYDLSGISNTNREAGLRDNIAVIKEVDKGLQKYISLFRLYFVIFWRKMVKCKLLKLIIIFVG